MNSKQTSLLAAFVAAGVEFAIVGGIAVNLHGYGRATNDLDIFIRPTEENAQRAFDALRGLGISLDGYEAADLLRDEDNLRFGPPEDHVDILSSIGEMPFDQVWSGRVETEWAGMRIPLISLEDLIQNKTQVARLRDITDVDELRKIADDKSR